VDLGDWKQLLKDKTESCDSEKKAYDKKLCETYFLPDLSYFLVKTRLLSSRT
jgi:hypothetical protein